MTTTNSHVKQVRASTRPRGDKGELVFALSLDKEIITLDPGTTWSHADRYKWVVRGLIEEPQMLHVFPDGSIEINSERIHITDPAAVAKLEHQINKRHSPGSAHSPAAVSPSAVMAPAAPPPDPRRFRVKLDHFDHLMIEWGHGIDREETGLRGLASLITNGLMRKPEHYRVDPMQRSIEMDGVTYDCTEAGAKKLEEALNTRYALEAEERKATAIEIKENLAASTGFDIHFRTTHAGVTHDIKGHLTQELLDLLQDPAKSDLIQPGIHLLLSPPNLLIRRRRPDMGEEKIPEFPDVNLLRVTSVQLKQLFNHPLIRRNSGTVAAPHAPTAGDQSEELARALKHSASRSVGGKEAITLPVDSTGHPPPSAAPPTLSDALPSLPYSPPPPDPAIVALFCETDALRINQEVFRRLSEHLGIAPQDICLSLPFVFENRRFEILNFERQEITSVMELRGTDFYGFYLSHVSEKKLLLVYACNGMHIEWGPDKCVLQPTIKTEAEAYPGSVLLGLAQDRKNEFVFVVQPEFRKWIAPREMPYTDENLQFLTIADIAAAPDNYTLIWPQRPAPGG